MAPRKETTREPAVVSETIAPQPAIRYIPNPVTVAGHTPRTRDEIAIRDAVRKALSEVEALVADFITEKKAERLSDADIDGRIRVSYEAAIVDRQA